MPKFSTDLETARGIHAEHYSGSFDVAVCKRSGFMDFPPFSWFYGASDIGSWDCIVSTDGSKIVITKSGYLNVEKVTKLFVIEKSDVELFKPGTFKNRIILNKKIKGLGKKFNFRLDDEFDQKGALKARMAQLNDS